LADLIEGEVRVALQEIPHRRARDFDARHLAGGVAADADIPGMQHCHKNKC
jgi:hypothetical protein